MTNLTFFSTRDELCALTGLYCAALWDAGFNLDDWDWGFVSDENYMRNVDYVYGETVEEIDYDIPQYIDFILRHCCDFMHVEYKDKHYYMVYHS